jgi:Astacin (Peptidase family M12A)
MKLFIVILMFFSQNLCAEVTGQMLLQNKAHTVYSITYEDKDGYAVVEDDIIVADLKNKHYKKFGALMLKSLGGSYWPSGIVPFMIDEDMPSTSRNAILAAMDLWQKNTVVQFVEISPAEKYYKDYVDFKTADGKSCSSYVGRQTGAQPVYLSSRCKTMETAHEIGHVLGLWHEQSRMDRDKYVKIMWENIADNYWYNFNQHINDGLDFGDYNYNSIMHYSAFAFSKNGERTIIPFNDSVVIGQRSFISKGDIEAVNALYTQEAAKCDILE